MRHLKHPCWLISAPKINYLILIEDPVALPWLQRYGANFQITELQTTQRHLFGVCTLIDVLRESDSCDWNATVKVISFILLPASNTTARMGSPKFNGCLILRTWTLISHVWCATVDIEVMMSWTGCPVTMMIRGCSSIFSWKSNQHAPGSMQNIVGIIDLLSLDQGRLQLRLDILSCAAESSSRCRVLSLPETFTPPNFSLRIFLTSQCLHLSNLVHEPASKRKSSHFFVSSELPDPPLC